MTLWMLVFLLTTALVIIVAGVFAMELENKLATYPENKNV